MLVWQSYICRTMLSLTYDLHTILLNIHHKIILWNLCSYLETYCAHNLVQTKVCQYLHFILLQSNIQDTALKTKCIKTTVTTHIYKSRRNLQSKFQGKNPLAYRLNNAYLLREISLWKSSSQEQFHLNFLYFFLAFPKVFQVKWKP